MADFGGFEIEDDEKKPSSPSAFGGFEIEGEDEQPDNASLSVAAPTSLAPTWESGDGGPATLPDGETNQWGGNLRNEGRKPLIRRDANGKVNGYSTTTSMLVRHDDGKFAVVPTVVDGEELSPEDAVRHYAETGEYWGVADDEEGAKKIARAVHEEHQNSYQKGWNDYIHDHWDDVGDEIRNDPGTRGEHSKRRREARIKEAGVDKAAQMASKKKEHVLIGQSVAGPVYGEKEIQPATVQVAPDLFLTGDVLDDSEGRTVKPGQFVTLSRKDGTSQLLSFEGAGKDGKPVFKEVKGVSTAGADMAGEINISEDDYNRMFDAGNAKVDRPFWEQVRHDALANTGDAYRYTDDARGTFNAFYDYLMPFLGGSAKKENEERTRILSDIREGRLDGYDGKDEAEKLRDAARKAKLEPWNPLESLHPGESDEDFAQRIRQEAEGELKLGAAAKGRAEQARQQTEATVGDKILKGGVESGAFALQFAIPGSIMFKGLSSMGLGVKAVRALTMLGSAIPATVAEADKRYSENITPEYGWKQTSLDGEPEFGMVAAPDAPGEAAYKAIGGAAFDTGVEVGLEAATMGLLRLAGKPAGWLLGKATPGAVKEWGAKKFNRFMASETGQALRQINRAYQDFTLTTGVNNPLWEQGEENVQALEKVLNLDGKTSEYKGLQKEWNEFYDRQFNADTQWDIFYGLIAQLGLGAAKSMAEGVARHVSEADVRRDVRMALARSGISEATLKTLTPEQQKKLDDLWRQYSADPDALKENVKDLGISMRLAVDELLSRESSKMAADLKRNGIPPEEFVIQTGADGKPAFQKMTRFTPDGKKASMNAMTDAAHGVTIVDRGDGTFYVMNDLRGLDAIPADSFANAQAKANAEVMRNQRQERLNKIAAQRLMELMETRYAGRNVVSIPSEAALRWQVAQAIHDGKPLFGITRADQLFREDGSLRQPGAGGFHTPDGHIVVILDNVPSPAEMERVLAHEATGHEGVEGATGRGANTVEFIQNAQAEGFSRFVEGERQRAIQRFVAEGVDEATATAQVDAAMATDDYKRESMARYAQGRLHAPTWYERRKHEANERRRAAGENVPTDQADLEVMLAEQEARGRAGDNELETLNADSGVRYEEGAEDETGNGAAEAPAQPEQGEERGQEAPRPEAGAEPGAQAPDAGVARPKTRRGQNLRGYSYEDYAAHPDDGGAGDQMGAELLRFARDNGGLLKIPPKGTADPLADWIAGFMDGNARKNRRGDFIALFGMKPRTGTNDALVENMPPDLQTYVGNMIEREGPGAVADWFLETRRKYREWAQGRRDAAREERMVAKDRAEEGEALESFDFDELAAARDAMDEEFANALGVVEGADEADYAALTPASLQVAKSGDTIRFDHDRKSFVFGSFDAGNGVLVVYDEDVAGMEGGKFRRAYRVTENSIEEIDDGQGNEVRADADRAGNEKGPAGGGGEAQGGGFQLESVTAEQITAEEKKRREKAEIKKRQEAPLRGSGAVNVQPEMDLGQTGQQDLFSPTAKNEETPPAAKEKAVERPAEYLAWLEKYKMKDTDRRFAEWQRKQAARKPAKTAPASAARAKGTATPPKSADAPQVVKTTRDGESIRIVENGKEYEVELPDVKFPKTFTKATSKADWEAKMAEAKKIADELKKKAPFHSVINPKTGKYYANDSEVARQRRREVAAYEEAVRRATNQAFDEIGEYDDSWDEEPTAAAPKKTGATTPPKGAKPAEGGESAENATQRKYAELLSKLDEASKRLNAAVEAEKKSGGAIADQIASKEALIDQYRAELAVRRFEHEHKEERLGQNWSDVKDRPFKSLTDSGIRERIANATTSIAQLKEELPNSAPVVQESRTTEESSQVAPKSPAPKLSFKRGDRVFIKGAKDGQRVTFLKANADGTADVQVRTPGANRYAPEKVETRTVPMGEISSTGMKDTLTDAERTAYRRGMAEQTRESMRNDPVLRRIDAAYRAAKTDAERNALKAQFAERVRALQGGVNFDTPSIYTGSAADYANRSRQGGVDDGPSLKKIGSGEGSQVYGWGLYGSTVRGVAEGYGRGDVFQKRQPRRVGRFEFNGKRLPEEISDRLLEFDWDGSTYFDGTEPNAEFLLKGLKDSGVKAELEYKGVDVDSVVKAIEENKDGVRFVSETEGSLYEQTFFTDRAPGDESHLLKWYEPVSEENANRILDRLAVEFGSEKAPSGAISSRDYPLVYANGGRASGFWTSRTGEQVYNELSSTLGSPQAASEFLARAGIDGVKYPVDSYGGKTVKDGDKAGWNYVSFRDDNIRVDHKWTDGVLQFDTPELSPVTPAEDAAYMDAVKRGDTETAQRMVREAADARLDEFNRLNSDENEQGFKYHRGPAPKETRTMYAVFNVGSDGFRAAYAGNANTTPVGVWLDAQNLRAFTSATSFDDTGKPLAYIPGDTGASWKSKGLNEREVTEAGVKGKGFLLQRGGKHGTTVPNFAQMNTKQNEAGEKVSSAKDGALPHNKLVFEIEVGIGEKGDLTDYVRENGRMVAGKNQGLAEIRPNQFYKFKTNPNANGEWGIAGTFRIKRLVPHDEIVRKTEEANAAIREHNANLAKGEKPIREFGVQKWVGGYRPEDFGLSVESVDEQYQTGLKKKLLDPVTYDDAGNVIPLSQRFNQQNEDIRFDTPELTPAEAEKAYREWLGKYRLKDTPDRRREWEGKRPSARRQETGGRTEGESLFDGYLDELLGIAGATPQNPLGQVVPPPDGSVAQSIDAEIAADEARAARGAARAQGEPPAPAPGSQGNERLDPGYEPESLGAGVKDPVSRQEIVDKFRELFSDTVAIRGKNTTRIGKYAGHYEPGAGIIRSKDPVSLRTIPHELGHHIDAILKKHGPMRPNAVKAELIALGKKLYGGKQPAGGYQSEGFAEMVKYYLQGNEKGLKKEAPAVYNWLVNDFGKAHPDIMEKMDALRDMIDRFQNQSGDEAVRAIRAKDPNLAERIVGRLADMIKGLKLTQENWIDTGAFITKGMRASGLDKLMDWRAALKRGDVAEMNDIIENHPVLKWKLYNGKSAARAYQALAGGLTDLSGTRRYTYGDLGMATPGHAADEKLPTFKEIFGGFTPEEMDEFENYAIARIAKEAYLDKGLEFGLTKSEIAPTLAKHARNTKFRDALERYTHYKHGVLHLLVDAGAMSQEQFEEIVKANPIYVKIARRRESADLFRDRMLKKRGKAVNRRTGSGRQVEDIFDAGLVDDERVFSAAFQADLLRSLVNLGKRGEANNAAPGGALQGELSVGANWIHEVPNAQGAVRFTAEQLRKQITDAMRGAAMAPDKAAADSLFDQLFGDGKDILTVFKQKPSEGKNGLVSLYDEDGTLHTYELPENNAEGWAKGLMGFTDSKKPNILEQWAQIAAAATRTGATILNPTFALRNIVRDTLHASTVNEFGFMIPGLSTVQGIAMDMMGSNAKEIFDAMGIPMGSMLGESRLQSARRANRYLMSRNWFEAQWNKGVKKAIADFVGFSENGTRIKEFKLVRDYMLSHGASEKAADMLAGANALDITIDFQRGGEVAKSINRFIPFFNAGIQGLEQTARAFGLLHAKEWQLETDRKRRAGRTVLQGAAWLLMLSLLAELFNRSDDDRKRKIDELKPHERWNYISFGDVRLPVPYEIGYIFSSIPRAIIAELYDGQKGAVAECLGMFRQTLPGISPTDIAFIGPALNTAMNEYWHGGTIVPEYIQKGKLSYDWYDERTSEFSKMLGKAMYKVFGQGKFSSPAHIDAFMNGITGNMYGRTLGAIGGQAELDASRPNTWPVVGTFFRNNLTANRLVGEFYERKIELERKKGSGVATDGELAELHNAGKLVKRFVELRKESQKAKEDKSLSATERNDRLEKIVLEMQQGVRDYNKNPSGGDETAYDIEAKAFGDANGKYEKAKKDKSVPKAEQEKRLSDIRDANPLMRDDVRGKLLALKKDIAKLERNEKTLRENGASKKRVDEVSASIVQRKAEFLDAVRKARGGASAEK